jgi:putative transcriptional regulator
MKSLAGQLLVASRHLTDPNFARTAVLIIEHGDEGSLGVVLNRITSKTVRDVWHSIGEFECDNPQPVNSGGPVPGPLIALHTWEELGEKQVLPGVYMSVQKDVLDQIVTTADGQFRVYSGHSGWGSGQLEAELEAGGWVTGPARVTDVFESETLEGDDRPLWHEVLNRIGLSIMLPGESSEIQPGDSSMN